MGRLAKLLIVSGFFVLTGCASLTKPSREAFADTLQHRQSAILNSGISFTLTTEAPLVIFVTSYEKYNGCWVAGKGALVDDRVNIKLTYMMCGDGEYLYNYELMDSFVTDENNLIGLQAKRVPPDKKLSQSLDQNKTYPCLAEIKACETEEFVSEAQEAVTIVKANKGYWEVARDTKVTLIFGSPPVLKNKEEGDVQTQEFLKLSGKRFQSLFKPSPSVETARGEEIGDGIKRYIEESRVGNFEAAATHLMYPENISPVEKEKKFVDLVRDIKNIHATLGDISGMDSVDMPMGKYRLYTVSMVPAREHPGESVFIAVPVNFTKAGVGVLNLVMGEIDGKMGIYEVQYLCFTCAVPNSKSEPAGKVASATTKAAGQKASRTDAALQWVFDKNKNALYFLYTLALRQDPTLQGKVVLKITIDPSGKVTLCDVVSSEMNAPEFIQKIVARVSLFDFGSKDVAVTVTTIPIEFLPTGVKEPGSN